MSKNNAIIFSLLFILFGLLLSILYHYYFGVILDYAYPYTTFLFLPQDRFHDFFAVTQLEWLNPYLSTNTAPSVYYPFLIILGFIFRCLSVNYSFIFYIFLGIVATALFVRQHLPIKNILLVYAFIISLILSYPYLFTIDRGNFELLVFSFLCLSLFFYKLKKDITSAIFLGLSAALKPYTIIFVLPYLLNKKYLSAGISIVLPIILNIISLFIFRGGWQNNLDYLLSRNNYSYFKQFTDMNYLVQRGVSLFSIIKIYLIQQDLVEMVNGAVLINIYIVLTILIGGAIVLYILFLETTDWKRVFLLVSVMILLPLYSGDYRLIYMIIPFVLFLSRDTFEPFDFIYLVGFCLLLIPKDYLYFSKVFSDAGTNDISLNMPLNVIKIIAMMVLMIAHKVYTKKSVS